LVCLPCPDTNQRPDEGFRSRRLSGQVRLGNAFPQSAGRTDARPAGRHRQFDRNWRRRSLSASLSMSPRSDRETDAFDNPAKAAYRAGNLREAAYFLREDADRTCLRCERTDATGLLARDDADLLRLPSDPAKSYTPSLSIKAASQGAEALRRIIPKTRRNQA